MTNKNSQNNKTRENKNRDLNGLKNIQFYINKMNKNKDAMISDNKGSRINMVHNK